MLEAAEGPGQNERTLTAWGRWVRTQPRGVLSRAHFRTQLAYSTVHYAQFELVGRDVAEALSKFSGGAVRVREMVKRKARAS